MDRAQDYNIINITKNLKPAFINFIIVLQFVILFWTKENTLKLFQPQSSNSALQAKVSFNNNNGR